MFASVGVTFHTILEIGNPFLTMLTGNIRLIMFMATITSISCVIARMAGSARDISAFAVIQGEGVLAVERSRLPRGGAVTGGAVRAKLTRMYGRLCMARNTGKGQSLKLPIDMTLLALHARMRARQREVGAAVVEGGAIPTRGGMAGRTVRAKLTVMLIILLMAGITIGGRTFEDIIDMALLAFHIRVLAFQLESGKVMVEGGLLPIGRGMAGAAVRAEGALVGILGGVAGIAILRCRGKISQGVRAGVTLRAGHARMSAVHLEDETGMAKGFAKAIHAVVAGEASRPVGQDMRLGEGSVHLTVATVAGGGGEGLDIVEMTVRAGKRFLRSCPLVSV